MAGSQQRGPTNYIFTGNVFPARTQGPLGCNDAGDPNCKAMLGDTDGPTGFNDYAYQLTKPVLGQVTSRPGLDFSMNLHLRKIRGTQLGEALREEMIKLSHRKLPYVEGLGPPFRGSVWRIGGVPLLEKMNHGFKCSGSVWRALVEIQVVDIDDMENLPLYRDLYAKWQRWDKDTAPGLFKNHGYARGTANLDKKGPSDVLSAIGIGYEVPMKEVLPGDILQSAHGKGEGHCAVVWDIERDENFLPSEMLIISANVNTKSTIWIESEDNAIKIQKVSSDQLRRMLAGTHYGLEGKPYATWVTRLCEAQAATLPTA
jgi:hypothetical protein